MATYNHSLGSNSGSGVAATQDFWDRRIAVLDFLSTATHGYNRSSADIIQMADVADKEFVLLVASEVLTAEGGTFTFDVGDGDDKDCYLDGVDGNAAAGTVYVSNQTYVAASTTTANLTAGYSTKGIKALVGGKQYAAADTVDMTVNDNVDAGKVRTSIIVMNFLSSETRGAAVIT